MQTGLIHEFRVAKSYKPESMSLKVFKMKVAGAVVDSPESYACKEVDGMFYWTLRQEAREAHLADLLSAYYTDFYGPKCSGFAKYCKPVIDYLSTKPSAEEFAIWNKESEGLEEMDGWSRRVMIDGEKVLVYFSFWSLSYEGKVMIEELEQHLTFFERAIRRMYADNPLGGSLAVDVG